MTESSITTYCRTCKSVLNPKHVGPCPYCGKIGKYITATINEKRVVKENITAKVKEQKIEKNYKILSLLFSGFIGSSIIGYIIGGPIGLAVGLIFGGLGLGFGYKGLSKTKIEKTFNSS